VVFEWTNRLGWWRMAGESVLVAGGGGGGADFLNLTVAPPPPPGGLTVWLVGVLRAAVTDGRLPAGSRLPPTRVLAADLGVSRGLVVEAYRRLTDEGLLTARTRGGTTVARTSTTAAFATAIARPIGRVSTADSRGGGGPERPRSPAPLLPLASWRWRAVDLDLSPGVPDLAAFPRAAWLTAERAVLTGATGADLGYGDSRGHPRLRHELSGWLARTRGVRAAPDAVLVVAGVAQALALLAQTLRHRGHTATAVEDPGSRGARDELTHWGLTPVPVPVDGDGMDVDALTATGLEVAVLTPAHQFPTGVVLAPARRRALLDWATGGRLVIEDDYDAEHRYDLAPVPALQPGAPGHVAHTGSTSKTLAPGMRLGWLVPPPDLYDDLVAARHASDLGSPVLAQLTLAHLLASGAYDRHLRLVRTRQRRRRDAVLTALHQTLPAARVEGVAAGLHLLITLPKLNDTTDDTVLADGIRDAGVLVHPLSWHRVRPGPPGLVLGYAAHPPDRLTTAVHRIAAVVRRGTDEPVVDEESYGCHRDGGWTHWPARGAMIPMPGL